MSILLSVLLLTKNPCAENIGGKEQNVSDCLEELRVLFSNRKLFLESCILAVVFVVARSLPHSAKKGMFLQRAHKQFGNQFLRLFPD